MKTLYTSLLFMISLLSALNVAAQNTNPKQMIRLHEDNDALNLIGDITDRSFTNGSRIDFFQSCRFPRHGLLSKVLPTAGDSSNNICGWSISQIMITPEDISTTEYQPDDYPYAGALFITRSFHSYNPKKKFSFQSELLVGIRGPNAFARQTQTTFHAMIGSQKPMGWHHQLATQPLINLNFTAEKNLFSWRNIVEVNGGVTVRVGSLVDAASVYPVIRIGKIAPYFDGFLSPYSPDRRSFRNSKLQYYLVLKATTTFVAYNAMLKGKLSNADGENGERETSLRYARYAGDAQLGLVVAYRNLELSYLLTRSSTYDKGLYEHRFGTVEICVKW